MKRARGLLLALVLGLGLVCAAGSGVAGRDAHSQSSPEQAAYFDWRDSGVVTPVRSQRAYPAGFAFTAAAMLESAIARDTGKRVDLSEQYLLNCAGGEEAAGAPSGWNLLDLFQSTYLPPQREPGAVLESVLPYRAALQACARAYPHPYRIDRWGYLNLADAPVSAIQQALVDHGPLGAALCAGPVFQSYRGGVYGTDESASCRAAGLKANHAVLITGWDDTPGCFWVKNSWGSAWGQGGYGCIHYRLLETPESVVFLDYRAAPGVPALVSPGSGAVVKTLLPLLSWKPAPGHVDGYQAQIGADAAFTSLVLDVPVAGLSLQPEASLPANARLYWRVRAWRGPPEDALYGAWSAARSFKTLPLPPAPLYPVDVVADSLRPTFTWEGAPAQRFDLQISCLNTCARVLRSATVSGPAYRPPANLPRAAALYWRVRARGLYGPSLWSPCVPFQTPAEE